MQNALGCFSAAFHLHPAKTTWSACTSVGHFFQVEYTPTDILHVSPSCVVVVVPGESQIDKRSELWLAALDLPTSFE
ncbi:hypothetical protein PGT21_011862 [Puccinia graminis f. sp. tritici]|uniref:Uncharacterized protein n=1 Tax=Puccinia graminis f. sp. tritici TaxID=56615 RepID=A0A5B0NXZ0_PUCGR|nr:hypothetical protein PGT21_011862 [Puccinia graminis f. sp. tritici]